MELLTFQVHKNTTHPVSPIAVYHSKVLNAVHEARQAAENSYDVARIDEKVNSKMHLELLYLRLYKSKCITATAKIASLLPLLMGNGRREHR
ncbi:hypothetical protein CUMW_257110 [Citrus unshiu]|uniref:Uncharacterized protein n=1 Tax=Citrus unshiu TaxID=55188 RepID=A0A2H5QSC6_CITUN|nr:hypothetical protein CUMW_257110 [Citrus unshiu]